MSDKPAQTKRLFIACFKFVRQDNDDAGFFQIAIDARNANEAAKKCRARLNEIADSSDNLGPVVIYLHALVEIGPKARAKGTYFNVTKLRADENRSYRTVLPEQGLPGNNVYFWDDRKGKMIAAPTRMNARGDRADDKLVNLPIFWSGVEDFENKLKLYWCETMDHDEDWFVLAHDEEDAAQFFEDYEGYDEGEAIATFVCVLPASEHFRYDDASWPEDDTLLVCGGEFLPRVTHDGADVMRAMTGSGTRVVRLKGNVYSEGDIVGNTMHRVGAIEES